MRRALYGQRSERGQLLVDQLELGYEELEASASEDEALSQRAAIGAFTRTRPSRKPLPAHLPRERVVIASPLSCPCCGSDRLSKLGEDVTETLEVVPHRWKVIQTVRERFACRACEAVTQPPAPFHATPRGLFGPSMLAIILFEKFGRTSRSTGNATAMPARASSSACRRSPTRSGPALRRFARFTS